MNRILIKMMIFDMEMRNGGIRGLRKRTIKTSKDIKEKYGELNINNYSRYLLDKEKERKK